MSAGSIAATGENSASEEAPEGPPWGERLRDGEAVARRVLDSAAGRNGSAADPEKHTLIVAPAGAGTACKRVVICFNGNIANIRQPEALQEYPDLHVIAVRDPERRFCLTGIEGIGTSIEAVSEGLLRIAHELGGEEIFCFGASAGGYPALRYAMEMKASGALLFSPPTTLDLNDDPGAPMSKYPQLARLYAKAKPLAIDLVPPYRAMHPRPSLLVVYSPQHKRDAWLAERLRNVPGTQMEPLEDCGGHTTLSHVIVNNRMKHYLDRLFELKPYN